MIELNNVSKQYADKLLFDSVDLTIYDGERVGVVGANGSGKTTLVRIIAGEEKPDSGTVDTNNSIIGYLRQITEYSNEDFAKIISNDISAKEFLKIKSLLQLTDDMDYSAERFKNLSGGEKTKFILAAILSQNPQVLILDEPTNHMDEASADWLIKTLNSYNGTIIVVSHDRYFLNKVANKIIEVENSKVKEYYGTYNSYKEQKSRELIEQKRLYEQQVAQEKKISSQIEKLNNWSVRAEGQSRRQGGMMSDSRIKGAQTKAQVSAAKLASQAKAKVSRLEQQKKSQVERPYEEGEVHYRLEAKPIASKVLVRAENVRKSFGNNTLFSNVNFTITAGDKLALRGKNGSGKTTLINMILGNDQDYDGFIWTTPSLKVGYLSQDVLDLDGDLTVMDIARRGGNSEYVTLFLSNLANMNMNRQVFGRKISTLSLGERMRIKMCELILSDFNMLILDEPTNHIDLANKIFLEKILKEYKGAMILVSHDRELTQNVCNCCIELNNKTAVKKEIFSSRHTD